MYTHTYIYIYTRLVGTGKHLTSELYFNFLDQMDQWTQEASRWGSSTAVVSEGQAVPRQCWPSHCLEASTAKKHQKAMSFYWSEHMQMGLTLEAHSNGCNSADLMTEHWSPLQRDKVCRNASTTHSSQKVIHKCTWSEHEVIVRCHFLACNW